MPRDGSPNKSRWQRVSSSILLILATSRPGTSESWSKRSLRSTLYRGQCRRKYLLFSLSLPQKQSGLRQSKACLKRCSFRALKCTRSFVNSLTPRMSQIFWQSVTDFSECHRFLAGIVVVVVVCNTNICTNV